jgi:hypothetical protein
VAETPAAVDLVVEEIEVHEEGMVEVATEALEEPGETGAAAMAMAAEAAGEGGVAGEAAALAKSQNEASKGPVAPPAVIPLSGLSQSIPEINRI